MSDAVELKVLWEQFRSSYGWEQLQRYANEKIGKRTDDNMLFDDDEKAIRDRREVKAMKEFWMQLTAYVNKSGR